MFSHPLSVCKMHFGSIFEGKFKIRVRRHVDLVKPGNTGTHAVSVCVSVCVFHHINIIKQLMLEGGATLNS